MSSKKIGILTFHNAINYGANIQAYALCSMLNKLGADVEIINYKSPVLEERYKIINKDFFKIKSFSAILHKLLAIQSKWVVKRKFVKFEKDYYILSDIVYSDNFVDFCQNKYDVIVVGSDQVWNYTLTSFDANYFLKGINLKVQKCSYAASIGIREITDPYVKEEYRKLLSAFNCISVREKNAVGLLEELGVKARNDIDPSLLLRKSEWEKLISSIKPVVNEKFIFVYTIGASEKVWGFAKKMGKKYKCKVFQPSTSLRSYDSIKPLRYLSPLEWLWCIYNAECVVTNSFHGAALSICLNKEFYVDSPVTNFQETQSRMESLLETFCIQHRHVEDVSIKEIPWNKINQDLEHMRNESLKYINSIVGNSEKAQN